MFYFEIVEYATLIFREVMSHPVITLHTHEKVERLIDVLKHHPHEGFPVVECGEHNQVSYIILLSLEIFFLKILRLKIIENLKIT